MRGVLEPGVPGHPGHRPRSSNAAEACGYETVGHFPLPAAAWWDDYYRPLQDNVTAFRKRYRDAPDAQELADQCQNEIDIWHAYSEFYSYEFVVLRKAHGVSDEFYARPMFRVRDVERAVAYYCERLGFVRRLGLRRRQAGHGAGGSQRARRHSRVAEA